MDTHVMIFDKEVPDGGYEYYCPECGRRVIFSPYDTPPIVELVKGDDTASHSGGFGGLQMGNIEIK